MSRIRLYNSRTRRKEPLGAAQDGRIGIYVCGITPYSVTHLGHAFTYTFFDVLGRFLRHAGYRTMYVQNLTDIDDDILKRAHGEGRDWRELGEENAQKFFDDQRWLGNAPPDIIPRATDHIAEMIRMIRVLMRRGAAYERRHGVYFDTAKDRDYGKLARLSRRVMLATANQRGNRPDDPAKKDSLDFVLWQARANGEPAWDSPWGAGRPGWHIECSAMAHKYLGDTIDIHGGGGDLIFPHHESEEAQSRAAHGVPLARRWMHTAMLKYRGEKMSKSLGNLVLISDLKKHWSANAVRLYLLSRHYRSAFEFFESDMERADALDQAFQKVWRIQSASAASALNPARWRGAFYRALENDMDTPRAIVALEALAHEMLKEKNRRNITDAKAFLGEAFGVLGLAVSYR
jgi:L-cysteine:1D-myo-inositol 2-amino-2-deoxy-alpha-D-glucopyranoside ligase